MVPKAEAFFYAARVAENLARGAFARNDADAVRHDDEPSSAVPEACLWRAQNGAPFRRASSRGSPSAGAESRPRCCCSPSFDGAGAAAGGEIFQIVRERQQGVTIPESRERQAPLEAGEPRLRDGLGTLHPAGRAKKC